MIYKGSSSSNYLQLSGGEISVSQFYLFFRKEYFYSSTSALRRRHGLKNNQKVEEKDKNTSEAALKHTRAHRQPLLFYISLGANSGVPKRIIWIFLFIVWLIANRLPPSGHKGEKK